MKILKFTAIAILAAAVFSSCKKDSGNSSGNSSIIGVYEGKFGIDNDIPDIDFKFTIKPNGIFQELSTNNGNPTGEGTYTLNGNSFTATYNMLWSPYNQYSVSGTFNPSNGKITGTWGFDTNPSDGGKIDMNKQ